MRLLQRRGAPPPEPPDEDDPIAEVFAVRRTVPAFLLSTAFHGVILVLLATITLVAVREKPIPVKLLDRPTAAEEEAEDLEGLPSLRDVAGVLRPRTFGARATGSVTGPSAPAVVAPKAAEMPRIAGIAPSIGASPGSLDIPLSIGGGGLAGGGPGGGFGDVVQGLRKVGIDLALVIDTTGSMQSVIEDVKREVRGFIGDLQEMVPASRVAVVAYRDKGEEYVTKWVDFSYKTAKVQGFVDGLRADGGGDYEEAVRQAIAAALTELSWGKRTRRIIILIGGSPPHKADLPELLRLVREFREQQNGVLGTIDVTKRLHVEYERSDWQAHGSVGQFVPSATPAFYRETTDAYAALANQGGGDFLALGEEKALLRQVATLTFGVRWRAELARYLNRLQ